MGFLAEKLRRENLTDDQLNSVIEKVVSKALSVANPSKIYLFGSSVTGDRNGLSDFDFAILFSDQKSLKTEKRKMLTSRLFPDVPVDLLFYTEDDFEKRANIGGVCWEIKNKGCLVYDQRTKV